MNRPLLAAPLLLAALSTAASADERHLIVPLSPAKQPVAPEELDKRIQTAAKQYRDYAPIPRVGFLDIAYPASPEEYEAMDGYAVLLVTAISQEKSELPPKRVYMLAEAKAVDLNPIASAISELSSSSEIAATFGVHRFDGLYLLPVFLRRPGASLAMDFLKNRDNFGLTKFDRPDENLKGLPVRPPTGRGPIQPALINMIHREYPGFLEE
ncbi:MAG: hypothetical protein ACRD1P_08955 [Thermoanaerobaculia bacterium]